MAYARPGILRGAARAALKGESRGCRRCLFVEGERAWPGGPAEEGREAMSLHSKIATFLGSRMKTPYCDDCISAELGGNELVEIREETERMRRNEAEFL